MAAGHPAHGAGAGPTRSQPADSKVTTGSDSPGPGKSGGAVVVACYLESRQRQARPEGTRRGRPALLEFRL